MNQTQLSSLFLNFIIYLIFIFPIIIILIFNKDYKSRKNISKILSISFIIDIILSLILYTNSNKIFSKLTSIKGLKNHAVYVSKILFISSSLYGLKFIIPFTFYKNNMKKKSAILVLSKIAVTIILIFLGYSIFNFKGILYAFPISDILFYLIYFYLFLKVIR